MDGSGQIEVADEEPDVRGERLQLLAVVRGLEALEQPSKVTLITPSRYVGRGIRRGLTAWRENDWQWERFGEMAVVKNADLWKRIDRAMDFHTVDCRVWNFGQFFQKETSFAVSDAIQKAERKASVRSSKRRSVQLPAWSDLAAAVADRVNPLRAGQVYGCT